MELRDTFGNLVYDGIDPDAIEVTSEWLEYTTCQVPKDCGAYFMRRIDDKNYISLIFPGFVSGYIDEAEYVDCDKAGDSE